MFKSKAFEILETFSAGELKEFKDFINSPYFNKGKNAVKLFEIFRRHKSKNEDKELTKEEIYKKLFPGRKYNDVVIRILMSDLLKLAENYLSQINFKNTPLFPERHLLKELQLRRLDGLFMKNLKEAEKILEDKNLGREQYYYNKHAIESIKNNFFLARDKQELTGGIILKKGESIICYSIIDLLIISESLKSNRNAFNTEFPVNFVDEFLNNINFENILAFLKENLHEQYVVIAIFYYLYFTFINIGDEKLYYEAKALFEQNKELFNPNEKLLIYAKLGNCCKEKKRSGNDKFVRELFELYKTKISDNLLVLPRRKYLNLTDCRDIIITATDLGEYFWCRNFIEENIPKLDPAYRENMVYYGNALILFGENKFEQALENISKVKYDYFLFKMDVKQLMIKIYYELGYIEEAFSLMDTFKHFLSKNRSVSEAFKLYNMNFAKGAAELLHCKLSGKPDPWLIQKKFEESIYTGSRLWLLRKVKELIQSQKLVS